MCSIQLLFTVFKLFTGFFELFLAVLDALRCGVELRFAFFELFFTVGYLLFGGEGIADGINSRVLILEAVQRGYEGLFLFLGDCGPVICLYNNLPVTAVSIGVPSREFVGKTLGFGSGHREGGLQLPVECAIATGNTGNNKHPDSNNRPRPACGKATYGI